MCCFSMSVNHVGATKIFARIAGAAQHLAYSMHLSVDRDVAMILPIPVTVGCPEDAVKFVNLEAYAELFDDLESLFPQELSDDLSLAAGGISRSRNLEVHQVGAFEASFVPDQSAFDRLDARFRLSGDVWSKLPTYADYGFAVFKLAGGADQHVHPMAFTFPTRDPSRTFFPTVHVHDGTVSSNAAFDHTLYLQTAERGVPLDWEETDPPKQTSTFDLSRAQGLVSADEPLYRRTMRGTLPNQDQWIE